MKPGIKTIIVGAVLFLVGAFVVPSLFVLAVFLGNSPGVQFKAPGSMETTVKEPGRYYLWNDFRTVFNGKSYDRSEHTQDGIEIHIRDADGRQLQFLSDTSISTSSGTSAKHSIGYVEVERPGKLEIEVSGGDEERIFSFSQSRLLKLFGLIIGGVGLSMLVGLSGLGLVVWGIVMLVRANKSGAQRAAEGTWRGCCNTEARADSLHPPTGAS